MHREVLTMICCSDLAGLVRGKGFPARELKSRLVTGVGWSPSWSLVTAFGTHADTAWSDAEQLVLLPDPKTEVNIDFADGSPPEHFLLGNLLTADGKSWNGCLRDFCRRALAALHKETGLQLQVAFEHTFFYSGVEGRPNAAYSLDAYRRQDLFAEALIRALRSAGVEPECFMPEFAPQQYRIDTAPSPALQAADRALVLRELTRATAYRLGQRVSFAPMIETDVLGNGVGIRIGLRDGNNTAVGYDAEAALGIGRLSGHFIAGILRYMPALCALTAPSIISYLRLQPQRGGAAYTCLGERDAAVRISPVLQTPGAAAPEQQFAFEYRAADASASPYLALGALVFAGLEGIRAGLPTPEPVVGDPGALSARERQRRGITPLPEILEAALQFLDRTKPVRDWLGEELLDMYLRFKQAEIAVVKHLEPDQQCARYFEVY